MKYLEHIQKGMDLLASDPRTIFIGQAMEYKGHAVSRQVQNYNKSQLLELPVAEELQAGIAIGLALEGYIPVSVYPRNDFAILAMNQIVNHMDKWKLMTGQDLHMLIKMLVGSKFPLNAGHQHTQNHSEAFKLMCPNIKITELVEINQILPTYESFILDKKPTIIIEHTELY